MANAFVTIREGADKNIATFEINEGGTDKHLQRFSEVPLSTVVPGGYTIPDKDESDQMPLPAVAVNCEFKKKVIVSALLPQFTGSSQTIGTGDGGETNFDGELDDKPVVPGTVTIEADAASVTDDGVGNLTGDGSGSINYMSGEVNVSWNDAPAEGVDIDVSFYGLGRTLMKAKLRLVWIDLSDEIIGVSDEYEILNAKWPTSFDPIEDYQPAIDSKSWGELLTVDNPGAAGVKCIITYLTTSKMDINIMAE